MMKRLNLLRVSAFLLPALGSLWWGLGSAVQATQETYQPKNPHGSLQIPCQNCHTTEGWKPMRPAPDFNHQKTRYPLVGLHARLGCKECHVKLDFSKCGTQCTDCHADIHRRQLGSDCEQCHSVRGWLKIAQKIDGHLDRFPLIGAHKAVQCEGCHKSAAVGLFRGLNTDCAFCHLNDYRAAKSIDHVASGFSTQCETCHSMDSWTRGFDHATSTGFALVGAHASLACQQCHAGGVFVGTPSDCVGCHLQDYNNTTNPNHVSGGFPQTCSVCHSMAAWSPASFNHNITAFPLTGAHTTVPCTSCHSNGIYTGTPTDCYACHAQNYNNTTNPNHASAGFPQTCAVCHNTVAWTPATFDHNATAFPLTGAHTSVACTSCHINGIYAGTPTDCYSCHSSVYNSTTDPNHVASGFPRTCADCHSTSTWSGATFNHTGFPIYSGTHAGRWTSCNDCHPNSSNYSVFTCTTACHPQSSTDANHQGIANYVYNSANCYSCHPTGQTN